MDVKELLKWGLIVVVVLVAWRFLSGLVSGIGANQSVPMISTAPAQWAPNYFGQGVYGPIAIPTGNPFYSSPYGSGRRRRWHTEN
jgi:hypothetical protein